MGVADAWRKFREGCLERGFGVSIDLDENLCPVGLSSGPLEEVMEEFQAIGKKTDEELDASFTEKDPLKKFKSSDFHSLGIREWTSYTFWCYWVAKYLEVMKFPYGHRTAKECMLLKKLLIEYGPEPLKECIDYVLDHYRTLKYLDGSRPSIAFVYGFRRTLVPEAHDGRVSRELTNEDRTSTDVNMW